MLLGRGERRESEDKREAEQERAEGSHPEFTRATWLHVRNLRPPVRAGKPEGVAKSRKY